jgi:polyphosphate kinase
MPRTNGKQVTALVELRARFDEANNIQWARRLEDAGAHVVYGVVGLMTHCKAMLVVRRESRSASANMSIWHWSTTIRGPARIYTDFSLFTTAPALTEEVAIVFNTLTGLAGLSRFEETARRALRSHQRLIGLIGASATTPGTASRRGSSPSSIR